MQESEKNADPAATRVQSNASAAETAFRYSLTILLAFCWKMLDSSPKKFTPIF